MGRLMNMRTYNSGDFSDYPWVHEKPRQTGIGAELIPATEHTAACNLVKAVQGLSSS